MKHIPQPYGVTVFSEKTSQKNLLIWPDLFDFMDNLLTNSCDYWLLTTGFIPVQCNALMQI